MIQQRILIAIVIYKCRIEESEAFKSLIGNSTCNHSHLFVYDNSPYIQTTSINVAQYVSDTNNSGLSKAYNTACRFAKEHGYNWILIADQDTHFPANALTRYQKAANDNPATLIAPIHTIGNQQYISPTKYRMKTSAIQTTVRTGNVCFKDACPINSGMMITVDSFIQAGGYEEAVWLDFSDTCFIEKYRKIYPYFYVMPDVVCKQSFSAMDTDPDNIYKRFCIYLECARNYPRHSPKDSLELLVTTLRPTISRTLRLKTLKYIKAYINIYIKNISAR